MWSRGLTLLLMWLCRQAVHALHPNPVTRPPNYPSFSYDDIDMNECVVDLGFVLDGSGSVGLGDWQVTIDYVTSFAEALVISPEKAQIGVVTFGNEASLEIKLNQYGDKDSLKAALSGLRYRDENTNTASGIRVAREQLFNTNNGDRPNVANIMIIITDGYPTREVDQTLPEAALAAADNIQIFTIGVGSDINMAELYQIAFNHSDHTFTVQTYANLQEGMTRVLGTTCAVAQNITISACDLDIGFVLDGSGSVGLSNWFEMRDFLREFADKYLKSDTRIGVVIFGSEAAVEIQFNNGGSNIQDFNNAVANLRYPSGNSNIAAGLRVARTQLFDIARGARSSYPDKIILITDHFLDSEFRAAESEAELARQAGISILTLAVGSEINQQQLLILAGNDNSKMATTPNYNQLMNGVDQLTISQCDCPPLDLTLILDASGSMGEDKWSMMKMFATKMIDALPMGPDKTRLALVTYSSEAGAEFMLNRYSTASEYKNHINTLPMQGQRTNIADAIDIVTHDVLKGEAGDRADAKNLVVLITDGKANVKADLIPAHVAELRALGVPMMVIGVGTDTDMVMLRSMASLPETTYLRIYHHLAMMVDDAEELVEDICTAMNDFNGVMENPRMNIASYPSNILFFMGTSQGSVSDFNTMKDMLATHIESNLQFLSNYQLAVYTMNQEIALQTNKNELGDRIRALSNPSPVNNFAARANLMRNVIANSFGSFSIVILTNSLTRSQAAEMQSSLQLAINDGVSVYVIAAGYRTATLLGQWYMDGISSQPAGAYQYDLDDMSQLSGVDVFSMVAYPRVPTEDICEDVLSQTPGGEPVAYLCGDQTPNGDGDQFDWSIGSAGTPSKHTGPAAAYSGSFYLYIEASYPRRDGDMAELVLPFDINSGSAVDTCLTFMYHMRGFHIGSLQIVLRSGTRDEIRWQLNGPKTEQEDGWLMAAVPLRMVTGDKIAICAFRAGAFSGDIAIDDMKLKRQPCPRSLPQHSVQIEM